MTVMYSLKAVLYTHSYIMYGSALLTLREAREKHSNALPPRRHQLYNMSHGMGSSNFWPGLAMRHLKHPIEI